jgi:hypothetical protein
MARLGSGSGIVLALVAGFIGGTVGNRIFTIDPVIAQPSPSHAQVMTVRNLIVTDEEGNVRAQLGISEEGRPRLDLVSKNGKLLASLASTEAEGGTELRLNAKDGSPRVRLAVQEKGEPRLDFTMEKDGRSLASLHLSSDGWPELQLKGKEGSAGAAIEFINGNPRVVLEDKKAQSTAVLATVSEKANLVLYRDGKPRAGLSLDGLDLIDAGGHPRARLAILETGEPRLALKDKNGHRLVSLSVEALPKKEEPLLAMYDAKDALRAGLSLDESGRPNLILRDHPLLSLIDKNGEDGIYLSLERQNHPSLLLSSNKGKHNAFLGVRDDNELALDLLDGANKRRAGVSLSPDGEPSIRLWNKRGKTIWSVPNSEEGK